MMMRFRRRLVPAFVLLSTGCGAAAPATIEADGDERTAGDAPSGSDAPRAIDPLREGRAPGGDDTTSVDCTVASFGADLGPGHYATPSDVAIDESGFVLHARAPIAGESDGELSKLAPDGSVVWTKPYGSVVTTDALGNVVVAGRNGNSGGVVVRKLAPNGTEIWAKSLGSASEDLPRSVVTHASGAIAISTDGSGVFVIESNGELRWQEPLRGAIAFDAAGQLVIAGGFSGTLELGASSLTSSGGSDAFVVVLDAQGNPVWSQVIAGGSGDQLASALSAAENGELVIAGNLHGSSTLLGEPHELPENPEQGPLPAAFVVRLDGEALPVFARVTIGVEAVHDVTTDRAGQHWLVGSFVGDVAPFQQTFVQKLDATGEPIFEQAALPSDTTGVGASHAVVTDACDSAVLALAVRVETGSPDEPTRALLARISP